MDITDQKVLEASVKDLKLGNSYFKYPELAPTGANILDSPTGFVPPERPSLMIGEFPAPYIGVLVDKMLSENRMLQTQVGRLRDERSQLREELRHIVKRD